MLLNLVTAVEETWLGELFSEDVHTDTKTLYDPQQKRVTVQHHRRFRDLVLESNTKGTPDPEAAAALLAREIIKGNIKLPKWDRSIDQWIARLNFLAHAAPELGFPAIHEQERQTLLEQVCLGRSIGQGVKRAGGTARSSGNG